VDSESIERFIEYKAFSPSYDWAPRPPPSPVSKLDGDTNTEKERQLAEGRVGGGGEGRAESNDSEKAWSSISHSILSVWLAYIL
jgi:hypothetical protein